MPSYSATLKKARADQTEATIGVSPIMRLYNGALPANSDAALAGNTLLADGVLPADWMANATNAGNVVTKVGAGLPWALTGQAGAGASPGIAPTFYRIYDAAGTNCHVQGSVSATGGAGEAQLNNMSIVSGQAVQVTSYSVTAGN